MHTLNNMVDKAKLLINHYTDLFKENIERGLSNPLFLSTACKPFECIKPSDYQYLQKSVHISRDLIDNNIQTVLINDLLKELIHLCDQTIKIIDVDRYSRVFIVAPNAYCTYFLEEDQKMKLKNDGIMNFYNLSFKQNGSYLGNTYVSFYDFLRMFLESNIIEYYEATLKEAIEYAYKKSGLTTSFVLTPENLSLFKQALLRDLKNPENYRDADSEINEAINNHDRQIMDSKFITAEYYKYLCGNSDVSRCFITSEYLFSITKEYVAFDYSSIVLGYYKCIELIVNNYYHQIDGLSQKRMKYALCNKYTKANCPKGEKCKLYNCCDNKIVLNKRSVFIRETNHKNLDLIYKLVQICCIPNHALISKDGIDLVYATLDYFRNKCRNGYVHADVMTDRKEAARIRKNAWVCIYYLLGGFDYAENLIKDIETIDFTYNKVYEALEAVARSVNKFIVADNGEELYVIRERERPIKTFNNDGLITTGLKFYVIDDFNEFKNIFDIETYSRADELRKYYITKDHIPKKIEFYSRLHKRGVVFAKP